MKYPLGGFSGTGFCGNRSFSEKPIRLLLGAAVTGDGGGGVGGGDVDVIVGGGDGGGSKSPPPSFGSKGVRFGGSS